MMTDKKNHDKELLKEVEGAFDMIFMDDELTVQILLRFSASNIASPSPYFMMFILLSIYTPAEEIPIASTLGICDAAVFIASKMQLDTISTRLSPSRIMGARIPIETVPIILLIKNTSNQKNQSSAYP